jgi:hypothetical protein
MKLEEKRIAEYLGEFYRKKVDLEAAKQTVSDMQLAVHAPRGLLQGYENPERDLEAGQVEMSLNTVKPKLMQRSDQTLNAIP